VSKLRKLRVGGRPVSVAAKAVLDRGHFEANTMYDVALQREILDIFLTQVNEMRLRLNSADVSPHDIKFLGHTLRGAAAAIGAVEFEVLGRKLEKQGGDPHKFAKLMLAAEQAFREAVRPYKV
jgi:HPt (histidine-containing phosphotransfer) domain-containing protein